MMKEVQRLTFISTFTIKSCYVTLVRVSKLKFKMYDIRTESNIIFSVVDIQVCKARGLISIVKILVWMSFFAH
jgi:hypothetical protein